MWTFKQRMPASVQSQIASNVRRFRNDEAGSLLIFTLFLFVMILLIAGIAVDSMRHETRRVALQNTLDGAILAAASLNQDIAAETLIKDHVAKAGMNPDRVHVSGKDSYSNTNDLTARTVNVTADMDTPTLFMGMMGIDALASEMRSGAEESIMNIEISMILDISGSMGRNARLDNLKDAAKDFVEHVLTIGPNASRTSVSIIPYNATVVVGDELLSRLNASGTVVPVVDVPSYPGALTSFSTEHNDSTCVRFDDSDFDARDIGPTTDLRRLSHFTENGNSFLSPSMNRRWCNEERSEILVHSTSVLDLQTHIEGLRSGGWTGIDNGMKWGVALLDPALAPVIADMVEDDVLDTRVDGRPGAYDPERTKKIVVLMTDGANTIQKDLKQKFKYGPTRVWHAESRTLGFDSLLGRSLTIYDGYYVLMPENDASERWYVPGSPLTTLDDYYVAENDLPADAVQLDHLELNRRFANTDLAAYLFEDSDPAAFAEYDDPIETFESYGSIDTRLQTICDKADEGGRIEVYAIGFEAPADGQNAMRGCASVPGNFFATDGKGISAVFDAIAGQITLLRLTN